MNQFDNIPPLPRTIDYQKAVEKVNELFDFSRRDVRHVLARYVTNNSVYAQQFMIQASSMAELVEEKDPETGSYVDHQLKRSAAFSLGSITGLMVAREIHGKAIIPSRIYEHLPGFEIEIDPKDKELLRREQSRGTKNLGRVGLMLLNEEARKGIEKWADATTQELVPHDAFMIANGLVFLGSRNMHQTRLEVQARSEIERFLENPHLIDWDKHFFGAVEDETS